MPAECRSSFHGTSIQKYEDGVWMMAADMKINASLLEKNCTFITPFTY